jgi:hypothetical protein
MPRKFRVIKGHHESIKEGGEFKTFTSPTYLSWRNMQYRVNNPNNPNYQSYGGRGITIDPKWNDFEVFLADMGEKPEKLTLDRIDNNKGYSKDNCRWTTRTKQVINGRPHGNSKFLGVSFEKAVGKYKTQIYIDGNNIHIGYFVDELEAAKAFDLVNYEWYGDIDRLNFKGGI